MRSRPEACSQPAGRHLPTCLPLQQEVAQLQAACMHRPEVATLASPTLPAELLL